MKTRIAIPLATLFAFSFNAFAEKAPGVAEFNRSTAELTASLLLEKLQADVLAAEPDSGALSAEMASNPATYLDPDDSLKKLETNFRDGIANRYQNEAEKYLDRLAGDAGRDVVFGKAFLVSAVALPAKKLADTVKRTYSGAFTSARTRVCKEQAQRLVSGIQPTELEFEVTPHEKLSEIMTARVAQAQEKPVFKENMAYITSKIVKPMLDAAEAQRKEQRAYLESQPVEGWAPEAIGKALEVGIAKFVAESALRHKEASHVAYGLFPSLVAEVPKIAESRAVNKVARIVDDTVVQIDSGEILKKIEENPIEHRTVAASMKTFAPMLEQKLGEEALARCESLVPAEEREAFKTFAETSLKEGQIKGAIDKRVRNVLLPEIKSIRGECSERQVKKLFGALVDETWFPSGALVDSVYAQIDYRKAVKGWRDFAELEPFAKTASAQPLMEESEKKLNEAVVILFDRGRMAQSRQHGIVDDVFGEIKGLISAEKDLPDLDAAVQRYTDKVTGVWAEERNAVLWGDAAAPRPANAQEQHTALFPSTVEKILLKVKSLMESIEKERQEKEATPEIPPEEILPQEPNPSAPEELKLIELDCRFEFDQKGSSISLVFYTGDVKKASLNCPHSPSGYRKEYGKTVDRAVQALLSEVGEYTAKGSKVALSVNIIVKNDLVYYGIVSKLVTLLPQKMAELSETGVTMEVKDAMME